METLKEFVSSGNPNAIKDISVAYKCLEAVQNVAPLNN